MAVSLLFLGGAPLADAAPGAASVPLPVAQPACVNCVVANISLAGPTTFPDPPVWDPGNLRVYDSISTVGNPYQGQEEVLNASSNLVLTAINVGDDPVTPIDDPANGYVYVPNIGSSNVTIIDGASNTKVATVATGRWPGFGVYDTGNGQVYVANEVSNNVTVLNGTTITGTLALGGQPTSMAYDSANGDVYVAEGLTGQGKFTIVEYHGLSVVGTVKVGGASASEFLTYDPQNGLLYAEVDNAAAPTTSGGNLSIISGLKVIANRTVGIEPTGAAFDAHNGEVYVANYNSNNVTVVNGTTVAANLNVVTWPGYPVYDSDNREVYVPSPGGNTSMSVLLGNAVLTSIHLPQSEEAGLDAANGDIYVNIGGAYKVSAISGGGGTGGGGGGGGGGGFSITSFTATPSSVVIGSSTTLAVTTSGGSGTFSYAYSGLPPGCSSANTSSLSCSPLWKGSFTVRVYVNTTTAQSATTTVGLSVTPKALSITSFTATPSTVGTGNSTALSVVVSGGTGRFTYTYVGLPFPCFSGNSSSWACTPSTVGSYTLRVYVNTTLGQSANTTTPLTVVPNSGSIKILAFRIAPSTVILGAASNISVAATGGSSALTYDLTGYPAGCTPYNLAFYNYTLCTPTATGTFDLRIYVNDTRGHSANATGTLTVLPVPSPITIGAFVAAPDPVTAGSTTTFYLNATGGSGPLSYAYAGLPTPCATADQSTDVCAPTGAGSYTVRGYVNDSVGDTANRTTTLVVTAKVGGSLSVTLQASPTSLELGSPVVLTASVSGGTGVDTYAYTSLPAGCTSSNASTLTCTPTAAGTYSPDVWVNDTAHDAGEASVTFQVVAPSQGTLSIRGFTASPDPIDVGETTFLNVSTSATGGDGILTYAFDSGLPPGCRSANTSSLGCVPTVAGTYVLWVIVSGWNVGSATSSTSLTVQTAPTGSSSALTGVSMDPAVDTLSTGTTVSITATPLCTGGACPAGALFRWSTNSTLGSVSPTTGATTTFAAGLSPGTVLANVSVTLDGITKVGSASLHLEENASGPASPSSGQGSLGLGIELGIVLALVAVIAVVGGWMVLRRRKKGGGSPPNLPPPPPPFPPS